MNSGLTGASLGISVLWLGVSMKHSELVAASVSRPLRGWLAQNEEKGEISSSQRVYFGKPASSENSPICTVATAMSHPSMSFSWDKNGKGRWTLCRRWTSPSNQAR